MILNIEGAELRADLKPLTLDDFDLILGMDWLSRHRAQVDCCTKTVNLQDVSGKRVVFKGERRVTPNSIISIMIAGKLIRKGCPACLSHVRELKKGSIQLINIPIIKEFPDVFPSKLPGLPPIREIEVLIKTLPEVNPIAQSLYKMAPIETSRIEDPTLGVVGQMIHTVEQFTLGSLVLFVKKKDGTFRLCIDYRCRDDDFFTLRAPPFPGFGGTTAGGEKWRDFFIIIKITNIIIRSRHVVLRSLVTYWSARVLGKGTCCARGRRITPVHPT